MREITCSSRLRIRELSEQDSGFILELLNTPGFLRYVGDKGVRDEDGARRYISEGPAASYATHGFGLWLVALKDSESPLGICGLIKRPSLADVDLGFAFLPQYAGQGYGRESAAAVMDHAAKTLELERVVAITTPDNERSIKLLRKLGFEFERLFTMPGDEVELKLFAVNL